jgi:hypothetical protein
MRGFDERCGSWPVVRVVFQAWLEGGSLQGTTDVHWCSKGGKASFNYRIKFPVELGPNTRWLIKRPLDLIQIIISKWINDD